MCVCVCVCGVCVCVCVCACVGVLHSQNISAVRYYNASCTYPALLQQAMNNS